GGWSHCAHRDGAGPPNTRTPRTLVSWSRTDATSAACSASTITTVASELSMTYCISLALKRYDTGTDVSPTLRLACSVVTTSSELGPHQAMRSPRFAPSATSAWASRLATASSSA